MVIDVGIDHFKAIIHFNILTVFGINNLQMACFM